MARWLLITLLVLGIGCAAAGVVLLQPEHFTGTVAFGSYSRMPADISISVTETWKPPLGSILLALGAGTTGAALAAHRTARRARRSTSPG